MAVKTYRLRVTLPFVSGLATDVAINDFSFRADLATADSGDLFDAAVNFYNTDSGAGQVRALCNYLSESASRTANAAKLDLFDVAVGGPPVASGTFTLGTSTAGTGQFPTEVAAALSFRGDYSSVPVGLRARHRGRTFLGPLDRITGEVADAGYRVSATFIADVLAAAQAFHEEASGAGFLWVVWSPTGALYSEVEFISMDNAFDTMRSRGVAPTSRVEEPTA